MESNTVTCPNCHRAFELTAAIEQPILDKERKKIAAEEAKKAEEATKSALESSALEMHELRDKLASRDRKLVEAQERELKLRKEKDEFEQEKRAFDLELARRSDTIKETVKKEKDEEYRLKEAEKKKQMDEMKHQIDDLKRKAEQGSQQTQGEVLEIDLENALRRCFPDDHIAPVAKGVRGGDLLHEVRNDFGHDCGSIIWESKRTKAWSDGWLTKLKDDKLAVKAQLAVLISATMPRDVASFECRDNVWIAPPNLAMPLAAALRLTLIETSAAKNAAAGRQDKMTAVYDYLSGPDFRSRVAAIFETFTDMRAELDGEKRAIQKLWAKREKQIDRVLANTAGLHGDLEGIIGKSLPQIETLQLAAIAADMEQSPVA